MHTIHESNYTVIKQPRNGNREINKNSSVYRSSRAQLMGWIHLIIFTHIHCRLIQSANAGRKTFSTFFKKYRFLTWWWSILRIQHDTNMLYKRLKSIWMTRSEMTGNSSLLIKNHISSILKSPVANFVDK